MPNELLEATRNFDQMKRRDRVWGDPHDEYWANQIKAGNIVIVEDLTEDDVPAPVMVSEIPDPEPEYEDEYEDEDED